MPQPPDFPYDVFLSHNARDKSRVLLLCLSPAALASGWVALERSTAVHRDPAHAGRRFIPLLLGDGDGGASRDRSLFGMNFTIGEKRARVVRSAPNA